MGWSLGWDSDWQRDIGYGVPSICDFPGCNEEIHRGLAYVCGSEPYGGSRGCGLFFCEQHREYHPRLEVELCERCGKRQKPFIPKSDTLEWIQFKLTDESWQEWREENKEEVVRMRKTVNV